MYNRYIPQPDGSYRRSRVQEPRRHDHQRRPAPQPKQDPCPQPAQEPCPKPQEPQCFDSEQKRPREQGQDSIMGFFKQLLPKDLDTADLLIIILLLLMAGDCEDDRNNALLTLALYFFM